MPWAICVTSVEDGRVFIANPDERIDPEDPRWGSDVHIAPFFQDPEDPEMMTFGFHEFTRECACGPQLKEQANGQTLVVHSDRVN